MLLFLWCWRRLLSPLDCKEIKPANPKGSQPWIFIGRTGAETEAPILWPPDVKSQLIGKKKLWCWERLNSGEEGGGGGLDSWMASLTQWTWVWANSGHSEGQGSLACCSPWGHKSQIWLRDWTTTNTTYKDPSHVEDYYLRLDSDSLIELWAKCHGEKALT